MNPDYFLVHNPYDWNEENYGPLTIPKQGVNVTITKDNINSTNKLLIGMKEKKWKIQITS